MTRTVDSRSATAARAAEPRRRRRDQRRWPAVEGGTGPNVELDRSRRDVVYLHVDGSALEPVTHRPPLITYLGLLWQRRFFIQADSVARVKAGTRATVLGSVWLILRPVMDAAAYLVIFGLIMKSDRGIENFIGYLIIGTFMFQFTTKCLTAGGQSLHGGRAMMRSFAFPRAVLPVSAVRREVLGYARTLAVMIVLVLVIPPGGSFSWRWFLLSLVVGLQVMLGLGLALIVARIQARVPDVQNVIGVLCRFWLYGSAVFFSFEHRIDNPTMLHIVSLNPMFQVLDITRDCLLYGVTPVWTSWLILGSWSLAALIGGFLFFWAGEERYGIG